MILDKITFISDTELDNKKFVEETEKLVRRIDRLLARAYEVEEWKEEQEYLKLFHNEIQKLVRSKHGIRS